MPSFLVDHIETLFDRTKSGLDRRLGLPLLRRKFKRELGYDLNLTSPQTWNEKLQWLKFNTAGDDYVRASDKLEMPAFMRDVLGAEMCEGLFTKIHYETDDADTIDFDALPDSYVIKPTHGSGWLQIVTPDRPADPDKLRALCKSWLRRRYGYRQFEWNYIPIEPRIMVEEMLQSSGQLGACDVKLHVFNGVIQLTTIFADRFGTLRESGVNLDWSVVKGYDDPPFDAPKDWPLMQDIALRVGKRFPYVRVDFLMTKDRMALNELTFFSRSGFNAIDYDYDLELGSYLTLPPSQRA